MKIAIVQFPGSNCERETMLAVRRAGMIPVEFLWNESHAKLREMNGYIIVGGFSYEDRSRAGIIAALDPVMREIKAQSELGKPVLGICNGAQILVETGLVPGLENNRLGMALSENKRIVDGKILGTGFYNSWIHMCSRTQDKNNAFTRHMSKESILTVPIAHAEGRFVMPVALVQEIEKEGLNVFQYCDDQGNISDNFPVNPNGSMLNIAAIMNKAGNVMAMMPHPERTPAGDVIFLSMRDYIKEAKPFQSSFLSYKPTAAPLTHYRKEKLSHELLVQLVITDNYALTVQNTLKQLGISVRVSRMVHWQINCHSAAVIDQIKQTGVLYNERKEYLVDPQSVSNPSVKAFLVRPIDDLLGLQKKQMLQDHFLIHDVEHIHHGILWIFKSEGAKIGDLTDAILNTNIIFNPNAHTCYEYENS
ncbi:phosphoribosylformylglycinamidine synthase I [Legionella maioricensis]|uniref:Phosphoribosylformylglycinamidine synthase I n=1 Tax=Legionella maioricensis TaxID=2896528 RepID=A0A9X2D0B2_9GAMM|nr:phosphoribosylformylglycinamidine synthase I [Legionella maioricensis]MCL9683745.1 phosphoribosylformylglycinamidine synthase I [Legionella maioricensis]MCL9687519.1 phosphoribosylformylglycinamidine synthase I [Legionella maioricensis]